MSVVRDSIHNKRNKLQCLTSTPDESKPYLDLANQLNLVVTAYLDSMDHSGAGGILTKLYQNIILFLIR